MAAQPDSLVLTGPTFQQIPVDALLVTPTGGSQQTMAAALSQSGQTSTNQILNTPTINGGLANTITATFSSADAIATAGSTQATGTQLTSQMNSLGTVTAGQGANLVASAVGQMDLVYNAGTANAILYAAQGNTVDVINTIAGSIGVSQPPGSLAIITATKAGTIQASGINPKKAAALANTASAAATLTAASLTQAEFLNVVQMTGSIGSGSALTLPTVASYLAALPFASLNSGTVLRVQNLGAGAGAWTLTANGSFAVGSAGTYTIPQNDWRDFNIIVVNGTSVTATDIGGGTLP